jgi:chemotaxis methyl-accepting protein methylase
MTNKTAMHWLNRQDAMELNEEQYTRWSALLEQRTGIVLSALRRSFLLSNLNIRMHELGITHYEDYYRYLIEGRRGAVEWEILVDRLTVHETRFYRDPRALELIESCSVERVRQHQPERFEVWSVGCATGEEAYSLAMCLDDCFRREQLDTYLSITATDVSSTALAAGRRGVYPANRLKNLPQAMREHYFAASEHNPTHYQIRPEIQRRVCFMRENLLELASSRVGRMDLIVCQNVLIYFQRERRIDILDHLVSHLKPGGLLVLGAGEILDWRNSGVTCLGQAGILAYRRNPEHEEADA